MACCPADANSVHRHKSVITLLMRPSARGIRDACYIKVEVSCMAARVLLAHICLAANIRAAPGAWCQPYTNKSQLFIDSSPFYTSNDH